MDGAETVKLYEEIEKLIPGAGWAVDNYGQVIIFTGLMYRNQCLVPFQEEETD